MSTKFEQLLDYLVNEEMEKANELFHEIVVEKSRDIYESLIAEEAEEDDEEMEESASEEDDEEMDEGVEELEDSYSMEADDEDEFGGDETDDFGSDVGADDMGDEMGDDDMGDEMGSEEGDGQAVFDIKNAIEELEAALAKLNGDDEFGDTADAEFGDEEDGEEFGDEEDGEEFGDEEETDEMMGMYEGRRVTREYVEKVGNDWEKNSQKTQGQIVGANSGEKMPGSNEGKSPISSGKGKPTTGATAANILGKSATAAEDGTKPHGKVGGLVKQGGKFTGNGTHNVDNVKSGVKTLSKQGAGYPGNNKSSGPVGSGTGDKAGQTNVAPETKKQFLPQYTK